MSKSLKISKKKVVEYAFAVATIVLLTYAAVMV